MTRKTKDIIKWSVIAFFCILFTWGVVNQRADAAEVRLGVSAGFTNGSDWIGSELMLTSHHWYGSVMRLGGDDELRDTTRLGAGYRVTWREPLNFSPYLRLGMAYFMDEPTDLISDRWAYDMALGLRLWKALDIEYQHNSTAGRSRQNSGNDMAFFGISVGF